MCDKEKELAKTKKAIFEISRMIVHHCECNNIRHNMELAKGFNSICTAFNVGCSIDIKVLMMRKNRTKKPQ